jgi:antitoxin component YwqK of YwqJK toxin-antitoxin module
LHREDGPAYIVSNSEGGMFRWDYYQEGKLHRVGAPASNWASGRDHAYYQEGKLHREASEPEGSPGPAVELGQGGYFEVVSSDWLVRSFNGPAKLYFRDGLLHRDNQPAVESLGSKCWYQEGKLHREDGPAVEVKKGHDWLSPESELFDGPCSIYYEDDKLIKEERPDAR